MKEIFEKLWKDYRQYPLLGATIGEPRRGALRGIIGCTASLEHLKASVSSHISEGYREDTPFIQTLRTRMKAVEEELKVHLRALNVSEEDYWR